MNDAQPSPSVKSSNPWQSVMQTLPPGYKQTDVGVIPEDWVVETLGSLCEVVAGRDLVKEDFSPVSDHRYKYPIYSNALTNRGFYGYSRSFQFEPDTITVTARGDIGHAEYRDVRFCAIGRLLVLSLKRQCDLRFVTEYINKFVNFALESTGVPQLTAPQISKYAVPLPPTLAEQQAIAEALSDVDALISALDRLITKKRAIKQGAMQELLTGRRRLPGFEGEWEMKRLGDMVDSDPENLGSDTSPDYAFNYITLEDVVVGALRSYSEQVFRSAPSRARRKLRACDVLVSTVRPTLMSHLLFLEDGEDWICSTGFCVVRCRDRVTYPGYVYYHLFSEVVGRQIDALLTGSNYPAINSGDVRALHIPFPDYVEQTAIATILSDMDTEIAALERRRDKTKLLKQGMMQELLTGRIRLM